MQPIMTAMAQDSEQFEDSVIIVGVGLIGGSIAAAIRQRHPGCRVTGVGRSEKRLAAAQKAGLLDDWATAVTGDMLQRPCVVVVCLPVNMIASQVCEVALMATEDVLITDAGSVKSDICNQVTTDRKSARLFVGAHPIAGGESGGFENAEAGLFDDRVCVVTPGERPDGDDGRITRTSDFWSGIGCVVAQMTPREHDRILALTSHLPHVMAAVITSVVGPENLALTGSGFRDATRIAAGSATLWKEILAGNREQVVTAIQSAEQTLADFRTALMQRDDCRIESLLSKAAACRMSLDS
ncbi:MAG: prephenate dehydrogenase/arogenate dehydrogenase family protein [Fuerstiella sp.]|nr:prephenate dehydrogenase/arogenate dehydrogenase family protein [Fuerstiella sp.]MCP4853369.1 prephenate dehydrogenase/arogenate dehydrogenase family protein [Fuerstiella sp.]